VTATASWYAIFGPNGDLSWRVTSPAEAIGAKVNLIPEEAGGDIYWPNSGPHFPWHLNVTDDGGATEVVTSKEAWEGLTSERRRLVDRKAVYPIHEGKAAVFTRPLAWLAAHMIELRNEYGIRVTAEVDDNYLSPNQLNWFMQKAGTTADEKDNHVRSICSTNGIIFSTEKLRDLYWKGLRDHLGRKQKLPDLFVCRNHVDERLIPKPIPRSGPLRVGYMGSDSHVWDVELIYPALSEAKKLGCEIVFVGIHPSQINPKYKTKHWDWEALDYTHIPWSLDYRGKAIPVDIGLAPLLVNNHTLGKSDIKGLEYCLSGAAPVLQNCEVFNKTFVHGETCLMAGSPLEFAAQTIRLIRDEKLRESLVANANQYITEERLLSKNVDEWNQAVYG
jgi:hypothetical protein